MRTIHRNRALLLALALALTTALPSFASDAPLTCTTGGGANWTVTVNGPAPVSCAGGEACTEIDYNITPNKGLQPDHVAILVEHDIEVVPQEGATVYSACQGDSVTLLGFRDCSSQTVRLNRDAFTGFYELVGKGNTAPIGASVVVKKGKIVEQCRIASLGRESFDVNAQVTTNQEINFKGCIVNIPTDPTTGEGGPATISGPNCVFVANAEPVSTGELLVNGQSVGILSFGNGALSSGTASCTTKVINRKIYTWCTCTDVNGDHIPDDPIPPCPATVP